MARYRKKPVVIEARQFTIETGAEVAEWCGGRFFPPGKVPMGPKNRALLEIDTLEGMMMAERGDWIIQGVKGEFYPCKPEIFEATYEAVEPGQAGRVMAYDSHRADGLMAMGLEFNDADPVARCLVGDCQWHGHGDSLNDAVLAWTAHLTADHRQDWPE